MSLSIKGRRDDRHYRRVDSTLSAIPYWLFIEMAVKEYGSFRAAARGLGISVQRVSELMGKLRKARRDGWAEK
jgi:hypothetical protein